MFSNDMVGSPYDAVGDGTINDIRDHEAMSMPEPGHSPSIEHSMKMAGEVLPIRGSEASEYTPTDDKAIRGQIKNHFRLGSDRSNVVPIRRPN